ncbi:MAG TPA: hypothetical protein VHO26_00540 [Propionibacteriaceae bacterium]|nr:hypothetical protein [Propionibacteriaceae bacterium]
MGTYKRPQKRVHRGFFYLDDETVINSLSAVESGKIDEIFAKVNSAREGGFGGGLGVQGAKVEGGRRSSSEFEEEMVRTRTRFSVFEIWYRSLTDAKALGTFDGWGPRALVDVSPGDTLEFRGHLEIAPIQTLMRLFLWFADKAKVQGHLLSQKGEELKGTKEAERVFKMLLGDVDEEGDQVIVLATPNGELGPKVAMPLKLKWLIGKFGQFGGEYTVVAQVDRILNEGDELPALRLTQDVAATDLEVSTLKTILALFKEPAAGMGLTITDDDAAVTGPALWLEPIAIFR